MKIGPVVIVATVLCGSTAYVVAQSPAAAKRIATAYVPAKTAWGDPSLAGVYTNNDESLIPFERPAQFEGRRLEDITETELEQLRDQRSDDRVEADRSRAEFRSPIHWFENHFPVNSRAWLVSDPPRRPCAADDARSATTRGCAGDGAGRERAGRFCRRPQPLRPMHHARRARFDDAGDLWQRVRDSARAGLCGDPVRDGS